MGELITDPADFDIWAKVKSDASPLVADWIAKQASISKIDAFRVISPAVKAERYIQIYSGYGWNDLPTLLGSLPSFVVEGSAVMTEQDCSPDYKVQYCELHKLYHRPVQCPICSGHYIHEGRRT